MDAELRLNSACIMSSEDYAGRTTSISGSRQYFYVDHIVRKRPSEFARLSFRILPKGDVWQAMGCVIGLLMVLGQYVENAAVQPMRQQKMVLDHSASAIAVSCLLRHA